MEDRKIEGYAERMDPRSPNSRLSTSFVDTIVAEVLKRLTMLSETSPSDAVNCRTVSCRYGVVSVDRLPVGWQEAKFLVVSRNAILTPEVKDRLRRAGVSIQRSDLGTIVSAEPVAKPGRAKPIEKTLPRLDSQAVSAGIVNSGIVWVHRNKEMAPAVSPRRMYWLEDLASRFGLDVQSRDQVDSLVAMVAQNTTVKQIIVSDTPFSVQEALATGYGVHSVVALTGAEDMKQRLRQTRCLIVSQSSGSWIMRQIFQAWGSFGDSERT